ncbi:flagellar basal-body rod protein FlgG [Notoacmeibacter sp. MSK16QG-6]|uniref:flagellar basal-body rod protein FlgG n=1 Tax=Notoacmeibacter sp. MSK16QG-6 TaxID=2957982 RepID=UPI0020A1B4DD|nr:flagellar basal-body rod protein FlgG [Notoacmeibacter sp. MSK16QG-6]MCP1200916.1 flagellar basal-body rod protein FlgG [Notoacmeibacter sp. MSK16QG-6]
MRALSIAATGMTAQQTNLEVIANNVANINTTGFKRARAEFTDLLYQTERLKGSSARADTGVIPEGAHLGLGVRSAAIRNVHEQGTLENTGNALDVALNGKGWFVITGANDETLYTRAGAFNTNAEGQIVMPNGMPLSDAITLPPEAVAISIGEGGQVFAQIDGQTELQEVGQITLASFANEAGLIPLGDNLFRQSEASGEPVTGVPGDPGFGTVRQGYLESSNVDPVKEITALIAAQRGYEMNSKVIQAADDMAATVAKNLR